MLVCAHEDCDHIQNSDIEWVVDSGASYHCVLKREYFRTYQAGDLGNVKMGNGNSSQILGIGDVDVQTYTGCKLVLKGVRHVPDVRMNFLAMNVLDKEGYDKT